MDNLTVEHCSKNDLETSGQSHDVCCFCTMNAICRVHVLNKTQRGQIILDNW